MALGDLVDIAEGVITGNLGEVVGGVAGSVGLGGVTKTQSRKGPVRGARLEYTVEALGGRLLIKEPFADWLGLTPIYPEYGTFSQGPNNGKLFTKRAGFRFKSYTILLKPGTKIKAPKATAAQQRRRDADTGTELIQIGNISLGVSANVNVHEFIDWLKASKQEKNINGLISPTLRKYQWGGILHHATSSTVKGK